ncbi:GTP:AMP phosphotransferase AK3, mitochondrial-like [Drosophila montana]|uniref:GTP:AMP phosphotransferase AK3, mitochondrial-like n=1 Tax=Drosophila montana TaxID=40370 RepID=UPI00313C9622
MFINFRYLQKVRGFRALIMGPPGSGKGYVSDKIVQTYGAVHICAGDILRKHIHNRTVLGKKASELISQGLLLPDHLLAGVISTAVYNVSNRNFILDGYPRTLAQAKHLESLLKLDVVFNLDIPVEAIIDVLRHRQIHVPSGRVYNEGDRAPLVPGRDDLTGEPLERRPDDRPKVVLARLAAFDGQTNPVIRFYRKKHILHTITGRSHGSLWPLVEKFLKRRWKAFPPRTVRPPRELNLIKLC